MKYKISKNNIILNSTRDFNIKQTLECGQVFSYFMNTDGSFTVLSADKKAVVTEYENKIIIETRHVKYFINYFDLNTDYSLIKKKLTKFKIMKEPINFGEGIRILKQDILETIISFVVSANNNIKRITSSLFNLRRELGIKIEEYYAFPTLKALEGVDGEFYKRVGLGYRSAYIVKLVKQLKNIDFNELKKLTTAQLREILTKLAGIGSKVADCILLFAFNRSDVFPVDTWIHKVYNDYFQKEDNRVKINQNLINIFGNLSGYAQQYLFNYKRNFKVK